MPPTRGTPHHREGRHAGLDAARYMIESRARCGPPIHQPTQPLPLRPPPPSGPPAPACCRHGPLPTGQPSRPRRGTQALGCTPHRPLVEQPSSADPQRRKYVLALAQMGTRRRARSRTAWPPTHLGRLRPVPALRERQHVFSLFTLPYAHP
jgi:hypothetical protein